MNIGNILSRGPGALAESRPCPLSSGGERVQADNDTSFFRTVLDLWFAASENRIVFGWRNCNRIEEYCLLRKFATTAIGRGRSETRTACLHAPPSESLAVRISGGAEYPALQARYSSVIFQIKSVGNSLIGITPPFLTNNLARRNECDPIFPSGFLSSSWAIRNRG